LAVDKRTLELLMPGLSDGTPVVASDTGPLVSNDLRHRPVPSVNAATPPDPAQLRAVDALQRCEDEWAAYKARRGNAITKMLVRPPIPRGVYMHGGVGRGKSFLMDCFFQAVPLQPQDTPALP
jgi:predicted ATPase